MIDSRSGFESMNPRPLTIEPHLVQIPMRSAVNISGAAARMQSTYINCTVYCIVYTYTWWSGNPFFPLKAEELPDRARQDVCSRGYTTKIITIL